MLTCLCNGVNNGAFSSDNFGESFRGSYAQHGINLPLGIRINQEDIGTAPCESSCKVNSCRAFPYPTLTYCHRYSTHEVVYYCVTIILSRCYSGTLLGRSTCML